MERVPSKELFQNPLHPYTKALLSAIPSPDLAARGKKRQILTGEVRSPIDPKPGCRFAARCPNATPACAEHECNLEEVEPGHFYRVCCMNKNVFEQLPRIHAYFQEHREELLDDIMRMIRIPSVNAPAQENAPFGAECVRALEAMTEWATAGR